MGSPAASGWFARTALASSLLTCANVAIARRIGFRRTLVRPRHPQADAEAEDAHKNFGELVRDAIPEAVRDRRINLWWRDEARGGRQGPLTYIRPTSSSRFVRSAKLELPYPARGHADAMNLRSFGASHVTPGVQAVVVLDGAVWH